MTEQKNVTVDYATGLFHYSVPLYTLRSGTYELPVSLDYIGKGVKMSDVQGMIGYNWTLNMGGVVTRVMRGGFPDEKPNGYLNPRRDAPPLHQDTKNVSLRRRDGESDLFTVTFGKKRVDFIIRTDKNQQIYAEPLIYTPVRIECKRSKYTKEITEWQITDDNGDLYVYGQVELSDNVKYVGASTTNAIDGLSYISAWHITRIVPYNGKPIEFCYHAPVIFTNTETDTKINIQNIYNSYSMNYSYGRPIREQSFDFERYALDFQYSIDEAIYHLKLASRESIMEDVNRELNTFARTGYHLFSQPLENEYVKTNNWIIGSLSNISLMEHASKQLENALLQLANILKVPPYGSNHELTASTHLTLAAQTIRSCLTETKLVREKDMYGGIRYNTYAPLPCLIITPNRIVEFSFSGEKNSYKLSKVQLLNRRMGIISSVAVSAERFVFLDKKGKETASLKFDYYTPDHFPQLPTSLIPDLWGYPTIDKKYGNNYGLLSSLHSLKQITLSDGGTIDVIYESNTKNGGGLRLKSLVFDDYARVHPDTLTYDYPNSPVSVYESQNNKIMVSYTGFYDLITFGKVCPTGHPLVNMGNNGYYHTCVKENISGKGTNIYRYIVSPVSASGTIGFWKNGLLKEKGVYDQNGNLLSITRYTYKDHIAYSQNLPQLQPSEFYLDEEKIRSHYASQTNPYIKGIELYEENIVPRLSPKETDNLYILYYGGKTVLEEEVEYRINTDSVYSRTTYRYDNPDSPYPTRIIHIGSDKVAYIDVCKRVIDIADGADSVIDTMKEKNLLSSVVKKIALINEKIVKEVVWEYQNDHLSDAGSIYPIREWNYIPHTPESYTPVASEERLYEHEKNRYFIMTEYEYQRIPTANILTHITGRKEQESVAYDYYGRKILECDVPGAIADDPYRGDAPSSSDDIFIVDYRGLLNNLRNMYLCQYTQAIEQIKEETTDVQFLRFLEQSESYFVATQYIEELIKGKEANLNKVQEYFEYMTAHDCLIFNQFKEEHQHFFKENPRYRSLESFIQTLETIVVQKGGLFMLLYLEHYPVDFPPIPGSYTISTVLPSDVKSIRIYTIDNNEPHVTITHSGGTETCTAKRITNNSRLNICELDLSSYNNVTKITAHTYEFYKAIVPAGSTFQATSYNTDGTVYCRFDQTGNAEFYTYDDAGRVIRVEDQYGKVIREYEYNQFINE